MSVRINNIYIDLVASRAKKGSALVVHDGTAVQHKLTCPSGLRSAAGIETGTYCLAAQQVTTGPTALSPILLIEKYPNKPEIKV